MKMLVEDRFGNIEGIITNNREDINLDLMGESRKKMYRKMLGEDDNTIEDLDDDVMSKSIYVFF